MLHLVSHRASKFYPINYSKLPTVHFGKVFELTVLAAFGVLIAYLQAVM